MNFLSTFIFTIFYVSVVYGKPLDNTEEAECAGYNVRNMYLFIFLSIRNYTFIKKLLVSL